MQHLDKKSKEKLSQRHQNHSLRTLSKANDLVDFSSNDYIGFSKKEKLIWLMAACVMERE